MFEFILVSLGVFRLAYLIVEEDGPGDIFGTLRNWSFAHLSPWFDAECPHCVAVWLSLPAAFILTQGWFVLVYWLAIAAVASFLISLFITIRDI